MKSNDWLLEGFAKRGHLTHLVSGSSCGKSLFTLRLMLESIEGRAFCGIWPTQEIKGVYMWEHDLPPVVGQALGLGDYPTAANRRFFHPRSGIQNIAHGMAHRGFSLLIVEYPDSSYGMTTPWVKWRRLPWSVIWPWCVFGGVVPQHLNSAGTGTCSSA